MRLWGAAMTISLPPPPFGSGIAARSVCSSPPQPLWGRPADLTPRHATKHNSGSSKLSQWRSRRQFRLTWSSLIASSRCVLRDSCISCRGMRSEQGLTRCRPYFWPSSSLQALVYVFGLLLTASLPWATRKHLDFWRAYQIYRGQTISKPIASLRAILAIPRLEKTLIASEIYVSMFFPVMNSTAFIRWDKGPTWMVYIGYLRSTVTPLLLACLLYFSLYTFFHVAIMPSRTIGWRVHATSGRHTVPLQTTTSSSSVSDVRRLIPSSSPALKLAGFLTALVWATTALHTSQEAVTMTIGITGVLFVVVMTCIPLSFHATSFRFHAIVFASFIGVLIVIGLLGGLIVFTSFKIGQLFPDDKSKEHDRSAAFTGEDSLIILPLEDLPFNQLFALFSHLWWTFPASMTAHIVSLAYRFDMHASDPALTVPSSAAASRALVVSRRIAIAEQKRRSLPHAEDPFGCVPVSVEVAASAVEDDVKGTDSETKAARVRLPTYHAALFTVVTLQIIALITTMTLLSTWFKPRFPIAQSDLKELAFELPYDFNFAFLAAWPASFFAVLTSAYVCNGRQGIRSLWMYSEAWEVPKPPQETDPIALEEATPLTREPAASDAETGALLQDHDGRY